MPTGNSFDNAQRQSLPRASDALCAVQKARDLLAVTTPLQQNCGELCGAACCNDEYGEELGMLLFPGEDTLYTREDAAWMRIIPSGAFHLGRAVPLLICDATCPREKRPLACRIFPLAPKVRRNGVSLRIDTMARQLCPLSGSGVTGLTPAFVQAAEAAFSLLWEDATQREYVSWLSRQVDAHGKFLLSFLKT